MAEIQVRNENFGIPSVRTTEGWRYDGLITGRSQPKSEYYQVAPGTVIDGPAIIVLDKATGTAKALAVDGQNAPNGPIVGIYPRSLNLPADAEPTTITVIHSCRVNFLQLKVPAALNTRELLAAFLASQGCTNLIGLDVVGGAIIDPYA